MKEKIFEKLLNLFLNEGGVDLLKRMRTYFFFIFNFKCNFTKQLDIK